MAKDENTDDVSARDPTAEALSNASKNLRIAQQGLDQLLSHDPEEREIGLRHLANYGFSVTQSLHRLKSPQHPDYMKWYTPFRDEMKHDPLMRFFYELRTSVAHGETIPERASNTYIGTLDGTELGTPPGEGAEFFMSSDGIGWIVDDDQGGKTRLYIKPPNPSVRTTEYLRKPPATHLGKSVAGRPLHSLGLLYLRYLQRMVDSARERWGKS